MVFLKMAFLGFWNWVVFGFNLVFENGFWGWFGVLLTRMCLWYWSGVVFFIKRFSYEMWWVASNDVGKSGLVLHSKWLLILARVNTLCFFGVHSIFWAQVGCGGYVFGIGLDIQLVWSFFYLFRLILFYFVYCENDSVIYWFSDWEKQKN